MNTTLPDPGSNLAEERQAVQSLLALLQREQAQLTTTAIDGLSELTAEKNDLLNRITALARTRYAALAAAAHSADEDGMRSWLAQGQHHAAHSIWNDLRTQGEAARELNRTNGLLIGKRLARNQAALTVLQGSAAGGSFYGPDGQSTSRSSNHRLIVG